jgi:hypothetical protein
MPFRIFIEHPASVGESYSQHLVHASGFGWRMVVGGLACLVHGVLPFLFVRTGSRVIEQLHDRMVVNRARTVSGADRAGMPPIEGRGADRCT